VAEVRFKVMKFGGTSVASPEARTSAALRVISAKEQGFRPIVVVSAIGRRGAPYATDTFIQVLREIDPNVEPEPREMDMLIACGEILSAVIFAHTLKVLGHPAQAFRGGQAGIRTDGVYGNARITAINPISLIRSAERGQIPVVCGFQGTFVAEEGAPGGELTTLGRGGSDTTAAALGVALSADAIEIFTDVDGVKTADPDAVPTAPTLRMITYDEVAEIAHLGAKVVHPRAAEIAMSAKIPLWVKNTFSDDEGTVVVAREQALDRKLTGVTHTGQLVYLQFDLKDVPSEARTALESRLYETMSKSDINLYMLNLSPSGTGFAVTRSQYPIVKDLLDSLVIPLEVDGVKQVFLLQLSSTASAAVQMQADLLSSLGPITVVKAELTEGCTMVSLVGDATMKQPGLFHAVLDLLAQHQIPVLQTSDSDFSLSVLLPESDCHRAVRLMHERFELAGVN
jgi:aspartate kinase